MEVLKIESNLETGLAGDPDLHQDDIVTAKEESRRGLWTDDFYHDLLMEQQEQF